MPQTHSRIIAGRRCIWLTERLWDLAKELPVKEIEVSSIKELDQDCWFGDRHIPTVRKVADHCRRILEADLSYPIILNADGYLMDGGHRLSKALIQGAIRIKAVQFETMPEPDDIEPLNSGEVI